MCLSDIASLTYACVNTLHSARNFTTPYLVIRIFGVNVICDRQQAPSRRACHIRLWPRGARGIRCCIPFPRVSVAAHRRPAMRPSTEARRDRCRARRALWVFSARFGYDPGRFVLEPGSPLRFVYPDFQQARGRDVAVLVAEIVRFTLGRGQLLIVLAELGQHVERRHIIGVVIVDAAGG
jgi:hypothetical protein